MKGVVNKIFSRGLKAWQACLVGVCDGDWPISRSLMRVVVESVGWSQDPHSAAVDVPVGGPVLALCGRPLISARVVFA